MLLERVCENTAVFCSTLPMSYLIHRRKLLFWETMHSFGKVVLPSLYGLDHSDFIALDQQYFFAPSMGAQYCDLSVCLSAPMSQNRMCKCNEINCTRWRGSVVERRSLAGELSLSCARPAADG